MRTDNEMVGVRIFGGKEREAVPLFVVRLGVRLGRMPQTVHNRCDGAEEAKHQC